MKTFNELRREMVFDKWNLSDIVARLIERLAELESMHDWTLLSDVPSKPGAPVKHCIVHDCETLAITAGSLVTCATRATSICA